MTPRPPPAAAAVFGDRLELAQRFAEWLTGPGIVRGLLGPREADHVWERHVLNGVGIASLIAPGSLVVDLGAGAGLPGLALALARPDLHVVLVEPKTRRVEFLREVCADLGVAARVVRARATPEGLRVLPDSAPDEALSPADVVTARAVASIANLGRWAAALLRPGGRLLAVKGASAATELERARAELAELGFEDVGILHVSSSGSVGREAGINNGTATVVAMTLGRVSRGT